MQTFALIVGDKRGHLCLCLAGGRVEAYSPLCALAGGAEVSISQPINSKTKHIICFQSFAEQITITTTILGVNKRTERKSIFICLKGEAPGRKRLFNESSFRCLLSRRVCTKEPQLKKLVWFTAYTLIPVILGDQIIMGFPLVLSSFPSAAMRALRRWGLSLF